MTDAARPIRLAAVAASPVFYQVPLYRRLAADHRVDLTVYFASSGGVRPYDAAFGGRAVVWDVDLLAGYRSAFLRKADTNDVLGGFLGLRDWDLFGKLVRGRYDAIWIHGYSYLTNWIAIAAAIVTRTPLLLREEQTLLHPRRWPRRWVRTAVLRALFRHVHGLWVGTNNRAYFERFGVTEERLSFAPYCVDNELYEAEANRLRPRKDELRAGFGIRPDAGPVILFVGKLTAKKQPLALLEAFARVRSTERCSLLFVGEGELEGELRAFVEARAVPDVHFAGFLNRSEISRAYAAADVFVLPSALHETWGLVVNEAMNFSLPVVVTDKVGCNSDLVRDGENGYVVRAGDVAALTTALHDLVVEPALRARAGGLSRELVAAWSYPRAAAGIVAACDAAARPRKTRATAGRPLRVALFALLPRVNAATRTFCERPLPHLARRGIESRLFLPSGDFAYRLLVRPSSRLRIPLAVLYWYAIVLPRRFVQLARALRADVIFVQRGLFRHSSPPLLEGLVKLVGGKLLRRRILYHCDDALYTVVPPRFYAARFRWADCVLTGNREIASVARRSNSNVVLMEGGVDVSRYPLKRHVDGDRVVLGWVGSGAPSVLHELVPALVELTRDPRVHVKVVSDVPFRCPALDGRLTSEPWTPEREFEIFSDFDIGVMPLADTAYNRGKEAFKLKEYMAAGLPVVASPVGHNTEVVEHGVNGFLASTTEEWVACLERLIEDPALRARLGAAGRRFVEGRYALEAQVERLADILLGPTAPAVKVTPRPEL